MQEYMDYDTFKSKLPLKLNKQQEEAVQSIEGPTLVLAVPGGGKTHTLVTRLGNMVCCKGIDPSNILILTYTVAATKDMQQRFAGLFGEDLASKVEFRTINSICAGIIKKYGQLIGRPPFELESNEKVLLSILSGLYQKYEEEYPTESEIKEVKTQITYIKNMMLDDEDIDALEQKTEYQIYDIYKDYCAELKKRRIMDFDDQMIYAYNLLLKSPELLHYYQQRYKYICVDEAQDTSKIQHEIIGLLADTASNNIFMVGDEDQSIYGFRAAYPQAMLSFEQTYKNAKVLLMEDNYRSNANIVSAADDFIQMNRFRHKKHMKATRPAAAMIQERVIEDRKEQYGYLLNIARTCDKQTAVLYRDNESVIPLVDMLERNNVSYSIRKAELSFFTNRVVLDIQNILRFAISKMDDVDLFKSIYYKLGMYLNKKTALEVCEVAKRKNISIFEAIDRNFNLKQHVKSSIKDIEMQLRKARHEEPRKAINRIINFMGYGGYLRKTNLSDKKLFTLKAIAEHEKTIESFLARIEELKNIIESKSVSEDSQFILSTIHASKGLEYNNVYIIDAIDGLFPESVPDDIFNAEKEVLEQYEEERRLFYVGVTRAKDNLFLFRKRNESSFVDQFLYKKYPKPKAKRKEQINITGGSKYIKANYKISDTKLKQYKESLKVGKTVTHKKFGKGKIVSIDNEYVKINFKGADKIFNIKLLLEHDLLK